MPHEKCWTPCLVCIWYSINSSCHCCWKDDVKMEKKSFLTCSYNDEHHANEKVDYYSDWQKCQNIVSQLHSTIETNIIQVPVLGEAGCWWADGRGEQVVHGPLVLCLVGMESGRQSGNHRGGGRAQGAQGKDGDSFQVGDWGTHFWDFHSTVSGWDMHLYPPIPKNQCSLFTWLLRCPSYVHTGSQYLEWNRSILGSRQATW